MESAGKKKRAWALAAVIGLAAAAGGWVWYEKYDTYHFAEVTPGVLYRDGNRQMRTFETAVEKGKIRTVVMLNDADELANRPQYRAEMEFCRQRGINLVHIPVGLGKRPTTDDVRKFLDVVNDPKNHPVLVHCAQGVRRTGMMVAAYQESQLKMDDARCKDAILLWGRKPPALDDVRGFIDDFDPLTRSVGSANVVERPQDED